MATTDGVGTKLKVAIAANYHNHVGIDLVAMCVNDLVVQGAEPLIFLDYYATGKLSVDAGVAIVAGIAEGCRQAGCALIGGESAEMPGMYEDGDYDLAGFSLGAVERDKILRSNSIKPGDVLIGLASNGLHSNGFSLVRKLVEDQCYDYKKSAPFAHEWTLAEALLRPTRIYVSSCLSAVRAGLVKGLSHITGGGLIENPPRVLPDNTFVRIDFNSWPLPLEFKWLRQISGMTINELARTFNCGIGMIAMVANDKAEEAIIHFQNAGETAWVIGSVEKTGKQPYVELITREV